jgi:peptidoglycan hydrolase FlgJ
MTAFKLSAPGIDQKALALSSAPPLGSPARGGKGSDPKDIDKAAREFEAVFLSQMLSHMWQGVEADTNFGGGEAENTWRGLMVEEYGKQIAKAGGLGMADQIKAAMLRMQEQADSGTAARAATAPLPAIALNAYRSGGETGD